MSLTEIRIGDRTIRYDHDATVANGGLAYGFAEECGCIFCQNFAAQRKSGLSGFVSGLLEQLGIDPDKEGEVFEYGPVKDGCHFYGGWFISLGRWSHGVSEIPTLRTPTISNSVYLYRPSGSCVSRRTAADT